MKVSITNISDIEVIQLMLDSGKSMRNVASAFNVHPQIIKRLKDRSVVEIYVAFDEEVNEVHEAINFEWLWEEDKLEEMCYTAFDEGKVVLDELFGENFYPIGRYVGEAYGDIYEYLRIKNFTKIKSMIYKKCTSCNEVRRIGSFSNRFSKNYGLDSHCKKCTSERVKKHRVENEQYKRSLLIKHQIRRAIEKLLPYDNPYLIYKSMKKFHFRCALTGESVIHLDHVIPLAIGHGGTLVKNIIPLRKDLNLNKKDKNIFEWFDANKERFNLPQERFDRLIEWLASANAMSVDEYRDYVYWCHANPRSIDELKALSEIGNHSTGKEAI